MVGFLTDVQIRVTGEQGGWGVNWWRVMISEVVECEVAGVEHVDIATAESERAEGAGARACGDGGGTSVRGDSGESESLFVRGCGGYLVRGNGVNWE